MMRFGPGESLGISIAVPFTDCFIGTTTGPRRTMVPCLNLEHEPASAQVLELVARAMEDDASTPRVHIWYDRRAFVKVIFAKRAPSMKFIREIEQVTETCIRAFVVIPEEVTLIFPCEGELEVDEAMKLEEQILRQGFLGISLYHRKGPILAAPYAKTLTDRCFMSRPDSFEI